MSRSILFTNTTIGSRSRAACLMTRSVTHITPSTASTTSSTASASRSDAVTSSEKLTCPGVSMKLNSRCFPLDAGIATVKGVALMETSRSCSS